MFTIPPVPNLGQNTAASTEGYLTKNPVNVTDRMPNMNPKRQHNMTSMKNSVKEEVMKRLSFHKHGPV